MVPSARKVIACVLLLFGVAVYSHSQTGPTKETTASISGNVTLTGKPTTKQRVVVADNAVSDVTVIVKPRQD